MSAKKWLNDEVKLDTIKDQTIAVIGYGIQGRAQSTNMRESGLKIIIGLRKDGKTWKEAENDGHNVMEVSKACQ